MFPLKHTWRFLFLVLSFFNFFSLSAQSIVPNYQAAISGLPIIYSIDTVSGDKILMVGEFAGINVHYLNPDQKSNVALINADGSLDATFELSGDLVGPIYKDAFETSTGHLVITSFMGNNSKGFYLVDKTGAPLDNFSLPEGISYVSLVSESKGHYYVVAVYNSQQTLLKFDETGQLDESFGTHAVGGAQFLLSDNSGAIYVVGSNQTFENNARGVVYKVSGDGTIDATFDAGTQESIQLFGAILQKDGKIFLHGAFTSFKNTSTPSSYIRLNADGSIDTTFNLNIGANIINVNSTRNMTRAVMDQEGNYYITGCVLLNTGSGIRVFSLKSDGTVNNNFSQISAPTHTNGCVYNLGFQIAKNEKFYLGLQFTLNESISRNGFMSFDKTGTISSVNPTVEAPSSEMRAIMQYREGKTLVSGKFFKINGERTIDLAMLKADGSLDTSFQPDFDLGANSNNRIFAMDSTIEGKLLIGGQLRFSGQIRALHRLNPNGTLDNTFVSKISTEADGIKVIQVLSNGKYLVAGTQLQNIDNGTLGHIAIMNSDGSVSQIFNILPNKFDVINDLIVLGDGSIIVAGRTNSSTGFISKINADGTLNTGFTAHTGLDLAINCLLLLDDRIVIGGYKNIGGSPSQVTINLIQMSLSGEVIDSSSIGINGNASSFGVVHSLQKASDGDILMGGLFDKVNSQPIRNFVKISPSGQIDDELIFDFSQGFINEISLYDADHAMVIGSISQVNNIKTLSLAKIKLINTPPNITGSVETLETSEETAITITVEDLVIEDIDDESGFTISIAGGDNYTVSDNVVTPNLDFNGTLSIPVSANDGKDEGLAHNLAVLVLPINDVPEVTGTSSELSVDEDTPLSLALTLFTVDDPDNTFPDDHTLEVLAGDNYSFDGNVITPVENFNGTIQVNLRINDQEVGIPYAAEVSVNPVNDAPIITGQIEELITDNETPL
ncbi:MAG TPA: hypothetical protein VIN11_06075, partial [Roseivirga sp.]